MADNITLNSGSGGDTLKTDQLADTSHVQYVKLMDGTADGTGVIPGDATDGLLVNLGGNNDITVTGTVTVDGSAVTQPVSAASLPLPSGAATAAKQPALGTAGAASTDVITVQGIASMTALTVDASGTAVPVTDNGSSLTVDGTVAVSSLPASTNTIEVVGDVAHDAAAAGNPVLVAASSETMADSAPANRVSADADSSRISATDGALYVIPTGPQVWSYHVDGSTALTDATVHAAPGANLSLYVTTIVFSSGAATAINAFFEESTSKVLGPYYLEAVAGRGMSLTFATPKKITANTALTVTTSAAIAHSIDVTGFIAPG